MHNLTFIYCIHGLFMPYWNFEYTKVYTVVKVRGSMGQDSATKTQAPVSSSTYKHKAHAHLLYTTHILGLHKPVFTQNPIWILIQVSLAQTELYSLSLSCTQPHFQNSHLSCLAVEHSLINFSVLFEYGPSLHPICVHLMLFSGCSFK